MTSMVVKAHPRLRVTTIRYNITASAASNFTAAQFWQMQRAYVDNFETFTDLGYYSYYRIRYPPTSSTT